MDEAPNERFANADDQLDRLDGLHDADDAGQHTKHAAFGAARNHARRRGFRIQATVARPLKMRGKDGGLALKTEDGTVDIRLLQEHADIVGEVAGREIVRAIDDDVVVFARSPWRCR